MKQPKPIKLTKLLNKSPGKEATIVKKVKLKQKDQYAFLHIPTGKYFHYNKSNMFPEDSKQILTASTKGKLISKFFELERFNFSKTYSIDNLMPQEITSNVLNPITGNEQIISTKIPTLISIQILDFWCRNACYGSRRETGSFQLNTFLASDFTGSDDKNCTIIDSEEIEFENSEVNLIRIFETLQTEGYVIDPGLYQFSSDTNTVERITLSEFEIVLYKEAK